MCSVYMYVTPTLLAASISYAILNKVQWNQAGPIGHGEHFHTQTACMHQERTNRRDQSFSETRRT